jgi:hypothetical protein
MGGGAAVVEPVPSLDIYEESSEWEPANVLQHESGLEVEPGLRYGDVERKRPAHGQNVHDEEGVTGVDSLTSRHYRRGGLKRKGSQTRR